jgi:DNA-binding Lrp family transcriptional regulator
MLSKPARRTRLDELERDGLIDGETVQRIA